ncbi:tyrosine recombinase XerC [Kushneria aurantia]|uniref:Tyrosine recombinase XerC n=1 Tax=Kushneria aurantia TaxID=504092 RepID=A0ABV6G2E9_9GAMM|nr:tyrosine recombinase XerC [Kushneria aurantia]
MSALEGSIERFVAHRALRASPATLDAYRRDLHALAAFLAAEGVTAWSALEAAMLRRFMGRERSRGMAPRSLARRLASIRQFGDSLVEERILEHNPARLVETPKLPRHLPRPVDVDTLGHFLDTPHDGSALALRDQAMLELFYTAGLRLAELAALDLGDLRDRRVQVVGKGGRARRMPTGRRADEALSAWLGVRATLCAEMEKALFVSQRGSRLGHRAIQQRLALIARQRGLPEHLHPHRLRHSFASHLLESSHDLRAVQELLGHAHLSTTQVYTRLDWQHLADTFDRSHPRARRRSPSSDEQEQSP